MKYFLTSGTNLELYFSCNDNLYEKGTLHFEAYNNRQMEGFPIIKEEIEDFDLRIAHESVYGTNKIVTGCNYSGDTWWFAWVDIVPESEPDNLTLDANDQPNEPLLNKGREQDLLYNSYYSGDYFLNQRMDVAGIAYGQSHLQGINITSDESSVKRVFFQLKNNVPGFPRFGINKSKNMAGMRVSIRGLTQGKPVYLNSRFVKRNYFCEQDLFHHFANLSPSNKYGLPSDTQLNGYEAFVWTVDPYLALEFGGGASFEYADVYLQTFLFNHYKRDMDPIINNQRRTLYDSYVSAPRFYPNGGPAFTN